MIPITLQWRESKSTFASYVGLFLQIIEIDARTVNLTFASVFHIANAVPTIWASSFLAVYVTI